VLYLSICVFLFSYFTGSYLDPHCHWKSHSVFDMSSVDVDQGAGALKSASNIVTPAYVCRLSDMRVLVVEWQPADQQVH